MMGPFKPSDRIRCLVDMKNYLARFTSDTNREIIEYLAQLEPYSYSSDNIELDDIAKALGIKKGKVGTVIKDLYQKCIASFEEVQTLKPASSRIVFCIHDHPSKRETSRTVTHDEKALTFQMDLDHVPRLGETVSLGFIDSRLKYDFGYVHEVWHSITPSCHEIVLHINATENFFFRWRRLKEDALEWDRFDERLIRMNEEDAKASNKSYGKKKGNYYK